MEHLTEPLPENPLRLLAQWLEDARADGGYPNPDAMALACQDAERGPSVRTVLCKEVRPQPGYLVFYTNYESAKARALEADARAAVVFHWDTMGRQVRVAGPTLRSPETESDAYFATRDRGSRIGAWASAQSQPLDAPGTLEDQVRAVEARFAGLDEIPRPPFWGGYRLFAAEVEVWLRGAARLHERVLWRRALRLCGEDVESGPWTAGRLQP